ncbi:hypothetical protein AYI68_g7787 [Smittium mucronatum]|uniref:Uncharacterized protein n=1 Tax=Smittium mucronatum TaxID=133383 RepID=A0A1R0GMQ6_9FUNG|nr:hypothetical protein AYI68_g7787 [Smittium mucronatum]
MFLILTLAFGAQRDLANRAIRSSHLRATTKVIGADLDETNSGCSVQHFVCLACSRLELKCCEITNTRTLTGQKQCVRSIGCE